MYRSYFGISESPFSITPDPRYLFLSRQHREALAHLLYGLGEAGGFVQLTGEVGTGKTTLCRALLEQVPAEVDTGKTTLCRALLEQVPAEVDVALILNPRQTAVELVATVCDELRVAYPAGTQSLKVLVDRLNRHLLEGHAAGRRTVLVVDEAQNLSPEVLEQVRLLTNLETASHKLLQVVLIGQPELREVLARPDLRQLAQRITARYHLAPLGREEAAAYVRHRLEVAGLRPDLFTRGALGLVYRCSGGVPRLVNVLCDRALLGAYARGRRRVGRRLVRGAAAEVAGTAPGARWIAGAGAGAAGFALLIGVAGVVLPGPGGEEWMAPEARRSAVSPEAEVAPSPAPVDLLGEGAGTEDAAYASLFRAWGLEYDALDGDSPCDRAEAAGLSCLPRQGSWANLARYGRPAVLELVGPGGERRYAALLALEGDRALLDLGGEEVTVSREVVDPLWYGSFVLLWRRPVDAVLLRPGSRGVEVRWLRERLAAVLGEPEEETGNPLLYDAALAERVRAFQRSRGLEPDGLVGRETLLQLADGGPRLERGGGV